MDQERRIISWSVLDEWPLSISACFDMRLQITFNRVARIFASLAVRLLRRLPRLADFDHSNATSAFLLVRFFAVCSDGWKPIFGQVRQARRVERAQGQQRRGRRVPSRTTDSDSEFQFQYLPPPPPTDEGEVISRVAYPAFTAELGEGKKRGWTGLDGRTQGLRVRPPQPIHLDGRRKPPVTARPNTVPRRHALNRLELPSIALPFPNDEFKTEI